MDQNPMMQGGNTPTQGGQPANTNPNQTANPATDQNVVVMGATIETTYPDGQVVKTEMVPKKKKNTGIIVLIVSLVVLILAAAGFAFWYFTTNNNPEKIAYDAITGFLKEKNTTIDGKIHGNVTSNGETVAQVDLDIKSATDSNSGESTLTLNVNPPAGSSAATSGAKGYSVEIGQVFMSDGVLYLRLNKIVDAIDQYLDTHGINIEDTDGFVQILYQVAEIVDGEWWRISVPEIIDMLAPGESEGEPIKEFYACMIDVMHSGINDELANLYSDNRYIQIAKVTEGDYATSVADHSTYSASVDYDKMANFVNAIPDTAAAESSYKCINNLLEAQGSSDRVSADNFEYATADDLREGSGGDFDTYLEIIDSSHTLYGITMIGKGDNAGSTISLTFSHEPVTVNTPSNYRPVTDLIEEVMQIVYTAYAGGSTGSSIGYNPITGRWELTTPINLGPSVDDSSSSDDDDWDWEFDDIDDI